MLTIHTTKLLSDTGVKFSTENIPIEKIIRIITTEEYAQEMIENEERWLNFRIDIYKKNNLQTLVFYFQEMGDKEYSVALPALEGVDQLNTQIKKYFEEKISLKEESLNSLLIHPQEFVRIKAKEIFSQKSIDKKC